jgi:hypothetical protein
MFNKGKKESEDSIFLESYKSFDDNKSLNERG